MTPTRRDIAALTLGLPLAWSLTGPARSALARDPQVIAGGGAVGDSAAGTSGAYDQAIRDGADFLASDFFPTKDGALVARPDHELSASTDVATRQEFAYRRQNLTVDGRERTGWFIEDFTLAELKTLVCGGPGGKRRGAAADHLILTFEEVVAVARAGSVRMARVVGVQAAMPHSGYFAGLDMAQEPRLANAIRGAGYNSPAAAMLVASDDPQSLKTIGDLTRARRVLRLGAAGPAGPPEDLAAMRAQAEAVAADPGALLDFADPKAVPPTGFIAAAHAAGLAVHAWTSDPAAAFPPPPFRPGDARRLMAALFAAGCEAVVGDLASPIARARDQATPRDRD